MLLFHKKSLQISREAFKYIFRLHQNYSSPECEITPVIIIEEIIIELYIFFALRCKHKKYFFDDQIFLLSYFEIQVFIVRRFVILY